ncbi:glycosyltransferase family 87 protein [Herpetosiphon sp. NSE202]|uniref:glycosyltransferase family 87 protein n=1 Tax=Herpetosiphon sp. NSE202 TaxID=3351349 RepID=UPI00363A6652
MLTPVKGNATILRFIKPTLIIIALGSFIQFTAIYGFMVAIAKDMTDFPSFYWASDAFFNQGVSPYNIEVIQSYFDKTIFPFIYIPPSILLFYPLSLMSYNNAFIVYLIINHIALLFFVLLLIKYFNIKLLSNKALLLIILIYNSQPILLNIYYGQINLFVIISLLLFIILRNNMQFIACAFLALATIIKMYPIIIILILLVTRKYKIFMKTMLALSLIIGTSMIFIPKFVWQDWFFTVVPTGSYGESPKGLPAISQIINQGFNGFFARVFTYQEDSYYIMNYPWLAKMSTYSVCAVVFAITVFIFYKYLNINHDDITEKIVFATTPLIFLIAPLSWIHHIILVYPTIIYLFEIYYAEYPVKMNIRFIGINSIAVCLSLFQLGIPRIQALPLVFILWVMMLEVIVKQQSLRPSASPVQPIHVASHA